MSQLIPCKVCESGKLKKRKVHRMSHIVVIIGYFILIPSIFGVLGAGCVGLAGGAGTGAAAGESMIEAESELETAGVPPAIIERVTSGGRISEPELRDLTSQQRQAVDIYKAEVVGTALGAGMGVALVGGMSLMLGISSLMSGLLGWLLIMKKTVLQCTSCEAVVAAS